jgi:hypothetical protein
MLRYLAKSLYLVYVRPWPGKFAYALKLLRVRLQLRPDYRSQYICINTRDGLIWVNNCGKERIFTKNDLSHCQYIEEQSVGHGGHVNNFYGIRFDFKSDSSPIYVGFGSPQEALLWKERADPLSQVASAA